jgi:hypothetical protein
LLREIPQQRSRASWLRGFLHTVQLIKHLGGFRISKAAREGFIQVLRPDLGLDGDAECFLSFHVNLSIVLIFRRFCGSFHGVDIP